MTFAILLNILKNTTFDSYVMLRYEYTQHILDM